MRDAVIGDEAGRVVATAGDFIRRFVDPAHEPAGDVEVADLRAEVAVLRAEVARVRRDNAALMAAVESHAGQLARLSESIVFAADAMQALARHPAFTRAGVADE